MSSSCAASKVSCCSVGIKNWSVRYTEFVFVLSLLLSRKTNTRKQNSHPYKNKTYLYRRDNLLRLIFRSNGVRRFSSRDSREPRQWFAQGAFHLVLLKKLITNGGAWCENLYALFFAMRWWGKKKVLAAMMIKSFLRVVVHVSTISFLSLSLSLSLFVCACVCVLDYIINTR